VVDKGFRGSQHHPTGVEAIVAGSRQMSSSLKRPLKRRSVIELVISHSKQDYALKRNYLRHKTGDRINIFLVSCGFNLRKLFRLFTSANCIRIS
jgi:transposase, IS5 family